MERLAFTGASCIAVVFGLSFLVMRRFGGPSGWMWLVPLTLVLLFFGLITLGVVERRKVRRLLDETDCRLCLNCRYVLKDLPDEGICPECGEGYDLNHLRAEWRDAYRVP